MNTIISLIKIARPIHWVKNFSLFAAFIFSGSLTNPVLFTRVIWAFIAFCLATSATYTLNDIADAKLDKLHPIKKSRPIASGKLSIPIALIYTLSLAMFSLYIASQLNHLFFLSVLLYLILQVAYSSLLKNIAIIDILIIASGFVIRVYSGAFVIDVHLSVWFLLCVISVSLFLASGKRRSELNIIDQTASLTRKSLTNYKRELLNSYVTMFGNAAWMSWALFTFFESPSTVSSVWIFLSEISRATSISKLLMITTPVVIFIIMRYESLIFEGRSEAPERLLLTDKSLVASIGIWTVIVMWILYGGVAVN